MSSFPFMSTPSLQENLMPVPIRSSVQPIPALDEAILRGLRQAGEFADADRAYCFKFHNNNTRMTNTHEWCRPGVEAFNKRLTDVPIDTLPLLTECILKQEALMLDIKLLPLDSVDRAEMDIEEINNLICVPIVAGQDQHALVLGFVGFDSCRERSAWSDAELAYLFRLSNCVARASLGGAISVDDMAPFAEPDGSKQDAEPTTHHCHVNHISMAVVEARHRYHQPGVDDCSLYLDMSDKQDAAAWESPPENPHISEQSPLETNSLGGEGSDTTKALGPEFGVKSGVGIMCSISFGVAVFMLPAMFAKTGVITGTALLGFFGLLSMRIMQYMLNISEEHNCRDMDELAALVPGGRVLSSASLVITLLVANAGHLQLIAGMLFDLLMWFVTDSIGRDPFNAWHKLMLLALFLGVALPYTFLEDLSMLKHVGKLVCCTCVLTCTVCVISCAIKIIRGQAVSGDLQAPWTPDSAADVFRTIPTVCFVYCSLFPMLHIYNSIKKCQPDPAIARRDINRCIVYSTAIQIAVFVVVSVTCTLTFGRTSGQPTSNLGNGTGNVLYNFPPENYLITALCFVLVYVIVLDYPILLFPATQQALKWEFRSHKSADWKYSRHAWALLFTAVILGVVMLVPDLEDVFGLGGSLGMSVHCYVVPGMIITGTRPAARDKLLGVAITGLGAAVLVVSTYYILNK